MARSGARRRNWYRHRDQQDAPEGHPVDREVERRLKKQKSYIDLARRILDLIGELGAALTDDQRKVWLRLEEALNARRLIVEAEYFNVGLEAGLGMNLVANVISEAGADATLAPVAAIRALAAAQVQIASNLDEPAVATKCRRGEPRSTPRASR